MVNLVDKGWSTPARTDSCFEAFTCTQVQKHKHKEHTAEAQFAPVPPAAKAAQTRAPVEQKPAQEVQRGYTLGEAAGLVPDQPETNEPPPAPWAGQAHTKGLSSHPLSRYYWKASLEHKPTLAALGLPHKH